MPADRRPLGELLVDAGLLTREQVNETLAYQRGRNLKFGEAVVALGFADENAVARALAKQSGLPFVDLTKGSPPKALIDRVPAAIGRETGALPIAERGGVMMVAIEDPSRARVAVDSLRFVLNQEVQCVVGARGPLRRALEVHYGASPEASARESATRAVAGDHGDDAPIVRLVQRMVEDAVTQRASDIHVEPFAS